MSERRIFDIESYEKIDPMEPKNYAVCWSIVDWTHEDPKVGDKFKVTEINPETETVVSKAQIEAAERMADVMETILDRYNKCGDGKFGVTNGIAKIVMRSHKQYQDAKGK